MVAVVAGLLLALFLLASALAKAADPTGTRAALSTYGLRGERATRAAWIALVAVEGALAPALALGWRPAAALAAVMLAVFAGAQGLAIAGGRAGAPCACLGARGRLGPRSLARTLLLLGLAVTVLVMSRAELGAVQWLTIGLVLALAGLAALAVVVLALAREIGVLRLAHSPVGALEVPGEGPELGSLSPLADAFGGERDDGRIRLAVFTSEGCALCHALAPAVAAFGRHPAVALRTFDEVADAGAWADANVPGSPYAVALDSGGTVLAKGTFNSGAQLETVLATAERRRSELGARSAGAAAETSVAALGSEDADHAADDSSAGWSSATGAAGEGSSPAGEDDQRAPVPPRTHAALAVEARR